MGAGAKPLMCWRLFMASALSAGMLIGRLRHHVVNPKWARTAAHTFLQAVRCEVESVDPPALRSPPTEGSSATNAGNAVGGWPSPTFATGDGDQRLWPIISFPFAVLPDRKSLAQVLIGNAGRRVGDQRWKRRQPMGRHPLVANPWLCWKQTFAPNGRSAVGQRTAGRGMGTCWAVRAA